MPELAFEFEFSAQLGRADFGVGPFGQRVLFRGTGGGIVRGERLNGVMEGPGGDWFLSGADGYGRIDVRSNIRTTDDALIYMQYRGLVRLTPAVLAMLNGEPDPGARTISIRSPLPSGNRRSALPLGQSDDVSW
jgi:Protein of unknown function (DUF3237)